MKKILPLLLAALFLFCFSNTQAQEYPTDTYGRWIHGKTEPLWFDESISKEDIAEITSRWHKIDKEDVSQNDLIGTYAMPGNTHINFLKWSPANSYIILYVNSCAAKIMRAEYGDARLIGEQIFFYPKKISGTSHHGAVVQKNLVPEEWVSIKWRGVNYLVPEKSVKDFCDYVGGFGESNIYLDGNDIFFGKGETKGSPDELPILPKRFENLVRKPINGKIVSVGKRTIVKIQEADSEPEFRSETQVVVNIGRADGVKEGMTFYALNENKCCVEDKVEILQVREKNSIGVIRRPLESDNETTDARRKEPEHYVPIKSDWKITTSPHIFWEYAFKDLENEDQQ